MTTRNLKHAGIVAGAVAIGVGAIAFFSHSKETPAPEPVVAVQMAKAERKPIQEVITTEAILFPRNQAAITPKIAGPVRKFYVNRGSRVHAGQLLAVLENGDLAASVTENKGAYEQAQAAFETTTRTGLPEDVKKAELDLKTAREMLDAQQKLYDSRQILFKEGALPRKELDQAAVSLVQAKAQFQLAKQHHDGMQAVGKPQGLKSAAGQLSSAKGKYEGASAQLGYSEIKSPIDGVVTDRPGYPGETPAAGIPLLTIMDTSAVIAKAHIPQDAAAALKVGNAATITAPGDIKAEGKVTLVSPALDQNSTTVEIWIEAPNPKGSLRPGTTVKVEVVASIVKDAITVPASAMLKTPEGVTKVMVVSNGGIAEGRVVETGIHDGDSVQITKGLAAGETIVASGAYGLPDKTHVKPAEPAAAAAKPEAEKE
jgi:multidrug efflux pump subunit AcrA (membrane-fusion protein)